MESQRLFKRINTLLPAQSDEDSAFWSSAKSFLGCALKIIIIIKKFFRGKKAQEPVYICIPWKVVAFCTTYFTRSAKQPWEAVSAISGHAPIWHLSFKWNYKAFLLGNRKESASGERTALSRKVNKSWAQTAAWWIQSPLRPADQALLHVDKAAVTSIYPSAELQEQKNFV